MLSMPLVPRTFWVDIELDTLSTYLEHMSSYVDAQVVQLHRTVQGLTKDLDPDDRHDVYEAFADGADKLERDFPRLLYTGYIASCYSLIETQFLRLCHKYKLRLVISALDREPLDTGVFRSREFLKEAAGYRIPEALWRELIQLNFVRNRLTHERGRLPTFGVRPDEDNGNYEELPVADGVNAYVRVDRETFAYLTQHDLIRYQGPDFILEPTAPFCNHTTAYARSLFHTIYHDLEHLLKKPPRAA